MLHCNQHLFSNWSHVRSVASFWCDKSIPSDNVKHKRSPNLSLKRDESYPKHVAKIARLPHSYHMNRSYFEGAKRVMTSSGCNFYFGFYFARPVQGAFFVNSHLQETLSVWFFGTNLGDIDVPWFFNDSDDSDPVIQWSRLRSDEIKWFISIKSFLQRWVVPHRSKQIPSLYPGVHGGRSLGAGVTIEPWKLGWLRPCERRGGMRRK